jgi:hypothetical protein
MIFKHGKRYKIQRKKHLIGEIEISTDEMLDIMIKEKLCLKRVIE